MRTTRTELILRIARTGRTNMYFYPTFWASAKPEKLFSFDAVLFFATHDNQTSALSTLEWFWK